MKVQMLHNGEWLDASVDTTAENAYSIKCEIAAHHNGLELRLKEKETDQ